MQQQQQQQQHVPVKALQQQKQPQQQQPSLAASLETSNHAGEVFEPGPDGNLQHQNMAGRSASRELSGKLAASSNHLRTGSQDSNRSAPKPVNLLGSRRAPSSDSQRSHNFASGLRSPSNDSQSSLQHLSSSLLQGRQTFRDEMEAHLEAVRGALENSSSAFSKAPRLHPGNDTPTSSNFATMSQEFPMTDVAAGLEETRAGLIRLQQHIKQQQMQQREMLHQITTRWEQRFAALEQALSSGLETTTLATSSMNERLAKFMSLAEVLEGAVERVISSNKDVATLSRRTGTLEDDVACLAQELASDRAERRADAQGAAEGALRQAETQVAALRDEVRAELRRACAAGPIGSVDDSISGSELKRLSREIGEERSERRKLALDVKGLLHSTNEQLMRISRELCGSSADASPSSRPAQVPTLPGGVNSQRLDQIANRRALAQWATISSRFSSQKGFGRIEEEEEEQQVHAPASVEAPSFALKGWGAPSSPADSLSQPQEAESSSFMARIIGR